LVQKYDNCCTKTNIRDLKAHGIAIVFITHFIDQVYKIADRISRPNAIEEREAR
jgi:ABC-type uncharacterized transport system ATPase subunit